MKTIGLLVLTAGVALSASFGARLAPDVSTELAMGAKVKVLKAAAGEAKAAYCTAREAQDLPHNANCPSPEDKKKAEEAAKEKAAAEKAKKAEAAKAAKAAGAEKKAAEKKAEPPKPDRAALLAQAKAAYEKVAAGQDTDVTGDAEKAQTVWLAAEAALIDPTADAAFVKPTEPSLRVTQWFEQSGIPFLGGLLLVFIGAIIGRRAVKDEASGKGKKGRAQAIDLTEAIGGLAAELKALADGMGETPETAQIDSIKDRLEALQFEAFQPIIESRGRAQVRFGIASYAELFGPFSSAERRANRAWSALVDKHWPEARASLRIAADQMAEAETILARLIGQSG